MELCGEYDPITSRDTKEQRLQQVRENIAKSVISVGKNQNVTYKKVYVGVKKQDLLEGEVGYAMATAPYVLLAKDAVPPGGAAKLLAMTISQWEESIKDRFPR